MRFLRCAALAMVFPAICVGQSPAPSGPTLQAILDELKAIHADMRIQTARTESMQLLIAELQTQSVIVTRAVQRVDAARSKTTDVQEGMEHTRAEIARDEDAQKSANNDIDKAHFEAEVKRLSGDLDALKNVEQNRLSSQQDAEASLKKAQDAYADTFDQLNSIVASLRATRDSGSH